MKVWIIIGREVVDYSREILSGAVLYGVYGSLESANKELDKIEPTWMRRKDEYDIEEMEVIE